MQLRQRLTPGFTLLLTAVLWLAIPSAPAAAPVTWQHDALDIETNSGKHHFTIELALSPAQQMQGLMYRQSLAADAGMLFLYDQDQEILMWMKNTLLPLDMVFITADGHVARVAERTVPQSLATISSGGPVRAVLEINAGTAARLHIAPGDKVDYKAFGP